MFKNTIFKTLKRGIDRIEHGKVKFEKVNDSWKCTVVDPGHPDFEKGKADGVMEVMACMLASKSETDLNRSIAGEVDFALVPPSMNTQSMKSESMSFESPFNGARSTCAQRPVTNSANSIFTTQLSGSKTIQIG